MAKTEDPAALLKNIRPDAPPHSVYLLYGDEPYFTDKLERKLVATYLPSEARDFNYTLLYGADTKGGEILNYVYRYPMFAERAIVVVREAQALASWDSLATLDTSRMGSNILIMTFKGNKADSRLKGIKALEQIGLMVESKEIRDYEMPRYIDALAAEHQLKVPPSVLQLLIDKLGTNCVQIDKELAKLALHFPAESDRTLSPEMIEQYTSLSRTVSPFELKSTLARRDVVKAMRLATLLAQDVDKGAPLPMIIATLYAYFSDLLIAAYAPDRSEQGLMRHLGLSRSFQVRDYTAGLQAYSPAKLLLIISYLRRCDARSKGVYGRSSNDGEILMDLVYFILH